MTNMLPSDKTFQTGIYLKTLLPLNLLFGTYGLLLECLTSLSTLLGTRLGPSLNILLSRLFTPLVLINPNPYLGSHVFLCTLGLSLYIIDRYWSKLVTSNKSLCEMFMSLTCHTTVIFFPLTSLLYTWVVCIYDKTIIFKSLTNFK